MRNARQKISPTSHNGDGPTNTAAENSFIVCMQSALYRCGKMEIELRQSRYTCIMSFSRGKGLDGHRHCMMEATRMINLWTTAAKT